MPRLPDRPGTYKIRQKGSDWVLSGLTIKGRRVKVDFDSEGDARDAVSTFFPSNSPRPVAAPLPHVPDTAPMVDDWGLPLVQSDTVQAVADAMGVKPASAYAPLPVSTPLPQDLPDEKQVKANQARAKSLCEFFGIAWASADVWVARKMTKSLGKDPVNPSTKQVNSLASAGQEALTDLFGDREIGPWTMALLLSIALPISMILQSPKAKALPSPQGPQNRQESEGLGREAKVSPTEVSEKVSPTLSVV